MPNVFLGLSGGGVRPLNFTNVVATLAQAFFGCPYKQKWCEFYDLGRLRAIAPCHQISGRCVGRCRPEH